MLRQYLRCLYRDRRRILLASLLVLATGQVASETLPDIAAWLPTEWLVVALLLVLIPVVSVKFCHYRTWVEVVALADLVYACLARALPGSAFDYLGLPAGAMLFNGIAWVATIATMRVLLYGTWSDRFAPRRRLSASSSLRSSATSEALFYGFMAIPGHIGRYAFPEAVSIDFIDPGHRLVRIVTWSPEQGYGEAEVELDEVRPCRYARVRMRITAGVNDETVTGTTELFITDHGSHRTVTLRHEILKVAPRRMLRGLLDDTLGRVLDSRVEMIERGTPRQRRNEQDNFTTWFDEPHRIGPHRAMPVGRLASGRPGDAAAPAPDVAAPAAAR